MGTWSTGILDNDTARDLLPEYSVAFWKYPVPEALARLDAFVRQDYDEGDSEEWANYRYSLAAFLWKKGILPDEVRSHTVAMIDSGFGLELWAEAGEKALRARQRALAAFREKLLSPLPPRKTIKPHVHTQRIFRDGDLVAIQLQTAGKPYTGGKMRPMTDEEFHACDGKYVLLQLIGCEASWTSALDPEVKDYWAVFRLFEGLYDTPPCEIDVEQLKLASLPYGSLLTPYLCCESSMFHFKRRKYQLLGNAAAGPMPDVNDQAPLTLGIDRPWLNTDSELLAAMGKEPVCSVYRGVGKRYRNLILQTLLPEDEDASLSPRERSKLLFRRADAITEHASAAEQRGARIIQLSYGGVPVGFLTLDGKRLDALYIRDDQKNKGFGTALLDYGLSQAGSGAFLDVPEGHAAMRRICEKLQLHQVPGAQPGFLRWQQL